MMVWLRTPMRTDKMKTKEVNATPSEPAPSFERQVLQLFSIEFVERLLVHPSSVMFEDRLSVLLRWVPQSRTIEVLR